MKRESVVTSPDFSHEAALIAEGHAYVVGVDEVGRGPLAGPVAVAAVILDPDNIPAGIDDSKALTAARRETLAAAIFDSALAVSIALGSAAEIDQLNIRGATLAAMRRAVGSLHLRPHYALIDGRDIPDGLRCPARAIIGGDAKSLSIAAASIIAKTLRDGLMRRACGWHPGYGFSQHVGYGTEAHRNAIARQGLCALHRRSFKISVAAE